MAISLKNIKNNIKAEAQKEAQKLKKAIEDTKKGVKGAKEQAKTLAEDIAKNTAVAPLLPFIPAMLYMLKKEKGLTYSASTVATKRYKIVEDFYKNIVVPYNSKKGNFDMVEMTQSDFEHIDEAQATSTELPADTSIEATTDSALSSVFSSAVEGGKSGAKMGAGLGTFLAGVGVPPPVSNLAGSAYGAQMGAIVGAIVKFFKLGLSKVKEALSKTGTKAEDLAVGIPVGTEEIAPSSSFDFKKLLLPLVAVVAIYFFVIKKK